MKYRHIVRFVPTGETPQSASETKRVTVTTSDRHPVQNTVVQAETAFRDEVTAYAAWSHWEAYDALTRPVNPPWGSRPSIKRDLQSHSDFSRIQFVKKGREHYAVVTHNESLSTTHIRRLLEEFYDTSQLGVVVQSTTSRKKRVMFQWETALPMADAQ